MKPPISGSTVVAGVVGSPIIHTLSPLLHNAWLDAAGLDGVYVPFAPAVEAIGAFFHGLRGGAVRGLNVTAPFKAAALEAADRATPRVARAGAANLLIFEADGSILADNTDGEGLLSAFAEQAPHFDPAARPVVILGAGGAARGAAAALVSAGAPEIRLVARAPDRARSLASDLGETVRVVAAEAAMKGAGAVVNAMPPGADGGALAVLDGLAPGAVAMDMVYQPLETAFLRRAREGGLKCVDGLAMLIGQARPSFAALFGPAPPPLDVRALALAALRSPR